VVFTQRQEVVVLEVVLEEQAGLLVRVLLEGLVVLTALDMDQVVEEVTLLAPMLLKVVYLEVVGQYLLHGVHKWWI
jgi:hypothetical protein